MFWFIEMISSAFGELKMRKRSGPINIFSTLNYGNLIHKKALGEIRNKHYLEVISKSKLETPEYPESLLRIGGQRTGRYPPYKVQAQDFENIVYAGSKLEIWLTVEIVKCIVGRLIVIYIRLARTAHDEFRIPELSEFQFPCDGNESKESIANIVLEVKAPKSGQAGIDIDS